MGFGIWTKLTFGLGSMDVAASCFLRPIRLVIAFVSAFWNFIVDDGDMKPVTGVPEERKVYILELNKDANLETYLFRIPKGSVLEVRCGVSLFGYNVALHVEYPEKGKEFVRNAYHVVPWHRTESSAAGNSIIDYARIDLDIAGNFHYFFTLDGSEKVNGSGYILVEPVLRLCENEVLELDGIQCITVLSKCLGPLSTWLDKIEVAKMTGYNIVHFTPIQELGGSNSSYCLQNHLKVNPYFGKPEGPAPSLNDVRAVIEKIRNDWKMLSICDIVLNHSANESEWLGEHPECGYNLNNSPHLRPAYLLDWALHTFSNDVAKGLYEISGIPPNISTEDHLQAIKHILTAKILPEMKIPELYMVDVVALVLEFQTKCQSGVKEPGVTAITPVRIIQDPEFRRLKSTVDMKLALENYNVFRNDCFDEDTRQRKCAESFKARLEELNDSIRREVEEHLSAAVENCIRTIHYFRIQSDGPKIKEITKQHPLFPSKLLISECLPDVKPQNGDKSYLPLSVIFCWFLSIMFRCLHMFTVIFLQSLIAEDAIQALKHVRQKYQARDDGKWYFVEKSGKGGEDTFYADAKSASLIMAHNGWVMNHDPLINFAEPGSNVYLRRELIAWGDSVKLRYGESEVDCPYLWNYMREYVETTASIFDGVRLDNCHSTPIPLAQYLLDAARKVKPNLYVVAELFTNSDKTDNIFVNKLGITSLIREALSAWDCHEEGRLVYRYGGQPVGSFCEWVESGRRLVAGEVTGSAANAHALFLDMTHDNPSPVQKRTLFDMLPSAALVSMAACASGTTMGYDQLVPHHIHVVDEKRQYMGKDRADLSCGISAGKLALNELHSWLSKNNFNQVFVDQVDQDIVCVTRHNEKNLDSVILFSYTAFQWPRTDVSALGKSIVVHGCVTRVIFEAYLTHGSGDRFAPVKNFKEDDKVINGLEEYKLQIKKDLQVNNSAMIEISDCGGGATRISLTSKFLPGSVIALRVSATEKAKKAVISLVNGVNNITKEVLPLNLADLNYALYTCSEEEESGGAYNIPNFGALVYCGIQGIMSVLDGIAAKDDLGHALCANIRDGPWLSDYTIRRFRAHKSTKKLGDALDHILAHLQELSPSMRPCYFHCVISQLHASLLHHAYSLMSQFVKDGNDFVRMLSLGSVQCGGVSKSGRLPQLSSNVAPPPPPLDEQGDQACLTLAAGLPHFSVGYMRSWGRDTFISLRGLFLLTGRFDEARYHILGYGGCLRHGLIPNLLDRGVNARFNCRDATWWWLYTIKEYTRLVPNGVEILNDKVNRLFPTDDSSPTSVEQTLTDVIQEVLSVHFQGLCFRERNAGSDIDQHMSSFGFDNQIGVHPITGFVFGGNDWNCGTWMDKMGSSEAAGTRGKPATPRDGSAVEIVALCKSTLNWLIEMNANGHYPHGGVVRCSKDGTKTNWTWKEWAGRIQLNFEKMFWVGEDSEEKYVNRKLIYKDTVGATRQWADYQLRPNFTVAMVVAPELFDKDHAWKALCSVEAHLLGPLGMRTLDPSDWAYCGYYDNTNNSNDPKIAHGYNYHQGPEWVWPIGYYLRAKLIFGQETGKSDVVIKEVKRLLRRHWYHLTTSPWRGLPELTNKDGAYCPGSCTTQAWSMATVLEVLHDIKKADSRC